MPSFVVTSPEGKKFKVNAPDGATPEQALDYAKKQFLSQKGIQPPVSKSRAVLDQALQGATFGFADELVDRLGAGIASAATGEKYSDLLGQARENTKNRLANEQSQYPVQSLAANIGGALLTGGAGASTKTGAALADSLRAGGTWARGAKGFISGAASGGLYGAGTAEEGERISGAGKGAVVGGALGAAVPVAGAAVSGIKSALAPKLAEGAENAVLMAQKYNIPLALDQITDGKARKYLASTAGRVPFSGGEKFAEEQQKAFNKAVLKTVAVDADKVTGDVVTEAYDTIGNKFDEVLAGKTIKVSDAQKSKLNSIINDASKTVSSDKLNAIKANIQEVLDNLDPNSTISGEKIGDLRSTITKRIRSADSGIREYLGEILDQIVDISASGDPKSKALLNEARSQYRNLKTIQPLLAKAENGNISPALLRQRVISSFGAKNMATDAAGELGELARVGALIKSKVGDTGTAERLASYAIMSSPGAVIGAVSTPGDAFDKAAGALAGAAGTAAAAKGFTKFNSSQANVSKAVQRSLPKDIGKLPPKEALKLIKEYKGKK